MSAYDGSRIIGQLLRQHEDGIKMYVLCRLGGAQALADIYGQLRNELVRASVDDLQRAPSLPAFAYATARIVSNEVRPADAADSALDNVVWVPTPEQAPPGYGELLDRILTLLDPSVLEALELHYARGLTSEDVAYVMKVQLSEATHLLSEGAEHVGRLANEVEMELAVADLIRDATRPDLTAKAEGAARLPGRAPRLTEGTLVGGRFEVASAAQPTATESIYLVNDTNVPGKSAVLHILHRPATTIAARNGLVRKLRLLESVVHASIGRVLDHGWHADRLWYATPWYEGHTLGQLLDGGGLSASEAIEIFVPAARGLAALHESGVVHRNISPETVLCLDMGAEGARQGAVMLGGFDAWLTGEVFADGDAAFIAPEVARRLTEGSQAGSGASSEDVFSLGLLLLQALQPRAGAPKIDLAERASADAEIPKSGPAASFNRALQDVLSLDPQARPSAAELSERLSRLSPMVQADRKRRRLWIPITIVLGVAALLLVAVFVRQSRLKLIRETQRGADAQVLSEELEAERARSRQLEEALQRPRDD
ncbi:MAG: hypothetical protein JRH17_25315 [Deltaproteobacteria bacterium]|nr:hypothetical protein [Deltaproteobacteria bacterium]